MPRSVYWPLRHMSHSPTAQFGLGTGSGRRTMPTSKSPFLGRPAGSGTRTRPRDSWPSMRRVLPGRPSVFPLDNLDVGTANPDRDGFYEYRAFANIRLLDLFPLSSARLFLFDGDRPHIYI